LTSDLGKVKKRTSGAITFDPLVKKKYIHDLFIFRRFWHRDG